MPSQVWGFAKTARLEEPALKLSCLDLDGAAGASDVAVPTGAEVEVALRGGKAFAPRLDRGGPTNPRSSQEKSALEGGKEVREAHSRSKTVYKRDNPLEVHPVWKARSAPTGAPAFKRLVGVGTAAELPQRLALPERGALTALRLEPQARAPVGAGQVEIRVRAIGHGQGPALRRRRF